VDDGVSVDVVDGGQDAVSEFLLGRDPDVAQHGTCELGEEPLDEIEPGTVLGRGHESEAAVALLGELGVRLLGDVAE
jgi:hypothetical protein